MWILQQNSGTYLNRQVQLEGLGPNGWYAMWQGVESDMPLQVNLQGLPFESVRMRYILANGCEYLSEVGETIPDPPDSCGIIEYELGEPQVLNGLWTIDLTLSDVVAFPLGQAILVINGGTPVLGPQLVVGENTIGPRPLGDTLTITITNTNNSDCNIVLPEIETECATLEVATEILTLCDNQPEGPDGPTAPIWGVLATVTPNPDFPFAAVLYSTPASPLLFTANPLGGGQYACGPLVIADDPGPMTLFIENSLTKRCGVELGPFEPEECGPIQVECDDTPQVLQLRIPMADGPPFDFEYLLIQEPPSGSLKLIFSPLDTIPTDSIVQFFSGIDNSEPFYEEYNGAGGGTQRGVLLPLQFADGFSAITGLRAIDEPSELMLTVIATCSDYDPNTYGFFSDEFAPDCDENELILTVYGYAEDLDSVPPGQYSVRYSIDGGITWSTPQVFDWIDDFDNSTPAGLLVLPAYTQGTIILEYMSTIDQQPTYEFPTRPTNTYCEGCNPQVDYTQARLNGPTDSANVVSFDEGGSQYYYVESDNDDLIPDFAPGWYTLSGGTWTEALLGPGGGGGVIYADSDDFVWITSTSPPFVPEAFAFSPVLFGTTLSTQDNSIYSVSSNRPVIVQVLVNGFWQTIWTGMEEDFVALGPTGTEVLVPDGATSIQAVYNYETCPVYILGRINS